MVLQWERASRANFVRDWDWNCVPWAEYPHATGWLYNSRERRVGGSLLIKEYDRLDLQVHMLHVSLNPKRLFYMYGNRAPR